MKASNLPKISKMSGAKVMNCTELTNIDEKVSIQISPLYFVALR